MFQINSPECTARLLNQVDRNNYPYNPNIVGNTGNRTIGVTKPRLPRRRHEKGRQNFELKLFGCKNVPYVGQINVRWWKKIFRGKKAPGGAKKLQGAPKSSRGRKKPIRKTEKIVATFFFFFFRRQ